MRNNPSAFDPVYIGETVSVWFNKPGYITKKPGCPDGFNWRSTNHSISELISEWQDFERKGKMNRNMRDAHARRAAMHGSLGVGRFYFRVRTSDSRVFDLYYDRSVKNAADSSGHWVLFQELISE